MQDPKEPEFRRYLKCGILAHGFARARCSGCGHDFLIAFSCKGRGVCLSCNARRMAETAAHLVDQVIPRLPVRQWVLSLPKRLRYFLQHNPGAINGALHIFLRAVEALLRERSPDAGPRAKIGAVAFTHRFGSFLNEHIHFYCVVIDGVFDSSMDANTIRFHEATTLTNADIEETRDKVRKRIIWSFVQRGFLDRNDGKEMILWEHGGGFSINASVRIEENDCAGLERLLRYCARPPFALERLEELESKTIVYHLPKPDPDGRTELYLTPFELIARIAALVPPPRVHRHRYFGVLAPNAPLRAQAIALAKSEPPQATATSQVPLVQPEANPLNPLGADASQLPQPQSLPSSLPQPLQQQFRPSEPPVDPPLKPIRPGSVSILWAMFLARLYEISPLTCPICGGAVRILSFITEAPTIRHILEHIGEPTEPPKVAPARGPPEWDEDVSDAGGDPLIQPAPDDDFDQSVSW
jgi:hypothetical protein